jgi:hypothetical protein
MTDADVSDFWTSKGDVSAVDPDDLKATCAFMRDVKARAPVRQNAVISGRAYENVCSPGANVEAVWYRAAMLGLLQLQGDLLTPWTHDGELDNAVIQVAATFPMKKMEVGVVQDGLPFDVQEFVKQIGART